jgi:hypothetical protein
MTINKNCPAKVKLKQIFTNPVIIKGIKTTATTANDF